MTTRPTLLPLALATLLLLALPARAETPRSDPAYNSWLESFRSEAHAQGIRAETLALLNGLSLNERVVRLDQSQPEKKITFAAYRKNILHPQRVKKGRELYARHRNLLNRISARYGVPGNYLVALWGIESNYGAAQGNFQVLGSLLTLAYEGRRATLFRNELIAALKIIDRGEATPETLRGSWAGAMGQCQFMPSTYLGHAVDGDDDGRRDIWNNQSDIFASMANYLKHEGWQPHRGWGIAAKAAKPVPESYVGVNQPGRTQAQWARLGVKPARKSAFLAAHPARLYYLVQPDGASGESFLVTDSYKAIMRWNRSTYFATTVGLLADEIAR